MSVKTSTMECGFEPELEDDSQTRSDEGGDGFSDEVIAARESKMVNCSKLLVVLVITVVAVSLGIITVTTIKGQEERDYKSHFDEVTSAIVQVTQTRAREIFDNLESVSAFCTTFARGANLSWPFVVIQDFQVQAVVSNKITGAATLSIYPLVSNENRERWEEFSQYTYFDWMEQAHLYDRNVHPTLYEDETAGVRTKDTEKAATHWDIPGLVTPYIWQKDPTKLDEDLSREPAKVANYYFPKWQTAPASEYLPFTNLDTMSHPVFKRPIKGMLDSAQPVLTDVTDASFLIKKYDSRFSPKEQAEPHSYLLQPVYDDLTVNRTTVAFLAAFLRWGKFFDDVLPEYEMGVMVVFFGTCGQQFSYMLNGNRAKFLGEGDLHDSEYDRMVFEFEIAPFTILEGKDDERHCCYSARVYPSDEWKGRFYSDRPYYYGLAVVACFVITTLVFGIFDLLVRHRHQKVMDSALRSNAIVSNLFPKSVKEKLMEEAIKESKSSSPSEVTPWKAFGGARAEMPRATKASRGTGCLTSEKIFGCSPLAELFPESTIMFADMAGFTAWSSERQPQQVFVLLETIYHAFDQIAKRRRVFKVETIGDCYVAVCGVPTPNKDHAVVMSKFAGDCLNSMSALVQDLEAHLGPDTSLLALRVGLHSGPVTAGVLRGDKGRFQLFGDTMNFASRMESTGIKGRVQVSAETASYLAAAGKDWTVPREDKIMVKGKGEKQTFLLKIPAKSDTDSSEDITSLESSRRASSPELQIEDGSGVVDDKTKRLVQWNVDVLRQHLHLILSAREITRATTTSKHGGSTSASASASSRRDNVPLTEEVKDSLSLPRFPANQLERIVDTSPTLPEHVVAQLQGFVTEIALLHPKNDFHGFEHASHVTMSVTKLMSRIINQPMEGQHQRDDVVDRLSHPLTQFACVLAALVHDTSHTGVPNSILVEQKHPLAIKYNGKSVAEQNSFFVAWNLLLQPEYDDLRSCICQNEAELSLLRSILIQLMMATDIIDKDTSAKRKARWEKAFPEKPAGFVGRDETSDNLKTTLILEHLLQSSDVSHTMQHWHIFRKWNERLFRELYVAHLDGRLKTDPSVGWYKGELGFFDHYVIPLAKRMEACNVFGVTGFECLSYAQANRDEWEEKGEAIVQDYLAFFKHELPSAQHM